jgi:hypothetical protein
MNKPDDVIDDKDEPNPYEKIQDAVEILMAPYTPIEDMSDNYVSYTTNEIIQAIEEHYGVPQGDASFTTANAGYLVVNRMTELGFKCINSGKLQLTWIMRKK